ncbi:MAG TPA: hypothetical protein VG845_04055 [Dehalococcoidia bacterium]|jgi:hypothetical protein|nr:hypothetical protein [Dehalococcoidia bacterium]
MAIYQQPGMEQAAVPASELQVLDVQRAYYSDARQRQAEHIRILYADGNRAGELRASISWEALAQLRSELSRSGLSASNDDLLGLIVVPWALEQLQDARAAMLSDNDFSLDFGDAPRPRAVRELLARFGFL